jgi:hypothetical protein
MKGKYISSLLVIFFACQFRGYAQPIGNPYEDAKRFLKDIQSGASASDLEELVNIVSYYSDRTNINTGNVAAALGAMPFLNAYVPQVTARVAAAGPAASNFVGTPSGVSATSLPSLGTNIADGLSKFLIERGKQELSMVFFDRFKDDLKKFPELTFLFPSTTEIINNIEAHNFHTLLQELKDAFMKDLSIMPTSILSLRTINTGLCNGNTACVGRLTAINTAFTTTSAYDARLVILPLIIMQGIIDGDNITEITNKLCTDVSVCGNTDNLSGVIQMASILFESLRTSDDSGGPFLNHAEVKNLFYSNDLLRIFFGLVYQKYNSASFSCYNNLTIAGQNLQGVFTAILNARAKFYSTLSSFDKINSAYISIQKSLRDVQKADVAVYASAISTSIEMLTNIANSLEIVIPGSLPPATLAKIRANLSIASGICSDIQQKNYAGIFNGTIKFIKDNNIITPGTGKDKLIKYLSFGANLAAAKTSDEVKEALNAVALPPGSYSIKQKSSFNIAVNGYVGYNWDFNGGLFANGVYAPIGISTSCGLGKKGGGAITLFTSIIDVGAVVSYRLKQGTTEELKQDIRLESIISPSAQLLIAIPKTPIALGPGWRKTPKLFYSNNTDFTVVKPKDVFCFSILIDIPIFTIKNSPYQ